MPAPPDQVRGQVLYDLGPVQDAIQNGGGHVADQFAPLVQRSVGSHTDGAPFVSAHDNLEPILAGLLGQFLDAQVVDYQQIDFEMTVHGPDAVAEVPGPDQFAAGIEDRAIEHGEPDPGRLMTDGLYQVRLADSRRTQDEQVGSLSYEAAAGQIHDLTSFDGGVEPEVEILQAFELPKAGSLDSSREARHLRFVLSRLFPHIFCCHSLTDCLTTHTCQGHINCEAKTA